MSKLAFSVPFSIISNKPTTTTEEFDAFHGFIKDCRSDEVARWSTLGQTCNLHGRWRHRAVGVFVTNRATLRTASDCADFFFLEEMSFAKVDVGVKYCLFLRMRTEKVL